MKLSTDRIITTHAGSLPRPPEPLKLVQAKVSRTAFRR
jgi:methionine synthase II (cobalamin-independent)